MLAILSVTVAAEALIILFMGFWIHYSETERESYKRAYKNRERWAEELNQALCNKRIELTSLKEALKELSE